MMGVRIYARGVYRSRLHWLVNQVLFPLKLLVPQPLIRRIAGLTTNEDLRIATVGQRVEGRLLDIGCGQNRLAREYRAAGGVAQGVDVFPWEHVDMVVEDTARLPFADGSFDTVSFVACLNHIPNRTEVLREAGRVLDANGLLLITNLQPWLSRVRHAWAFWDRDQHERGMAPGEVWGLSARQMRELLSAAGFDIEERRYFAWGLNQLWVARKRQGGAGRGA